MGELAGTLDAGEVLARLRAEHGYTILLVEQNAKAALRVSDRAYVLASGLITHAGTAQELLSSQEVQEQYLGKKAAT